MIEKYMAAFKNVFVVLLFLLSIAAVSYQIKDSKFFIRETKENAPEEHQVCLHNGMELVKQELYDQGIEWYEKAIEAKPDFGLSYFCMANAYRLKNEPQYAVEYYKKAIQFQPENNMSYYMLGVSYFSMGDKEKAMEAYYTLKQKDNDLAEKLMYMISG